MTLRPFRIILILVTSLIPLALLAVLIFLARYSWPALTFNGWHFLVGHTWSLGNLYANPVKRHGVLVPIGADYGILVFIVGTLLTSAIALAIAIPVSLGVAIFLAEGLRSRRLKAPLSFVVEMLAAVPSVVYGLWGYAVLTPLVAHTLGPGLRAVLGFVPFFAGPIGSGYGLLAASIVLALMVVPIIAATVRDALARVPSETKEAAYALGATHFEVVRRAMLPTVRGNIIGAGILGLGRALGETMAVLMVSGGALNYFPGNIYSPITTMASFIVSQLDSAMQDPTGMAVRSLAEIALILFIISVITNIIARLLTGASRNATLV
ncbi:phosphate ABC transporter permease subunit PstC [Acidiferrobacter sp.]|jgi:phosphate transport system permease protein|uniref:phosphate ABC transporter permease subunit PstC n=1 Tax=Acidiferrobacter sp. TaxID=1872107 RepID=UPI002625A71D|nr:phosphate ABC transporter permease subunit PstC [Acidiferrobacter sp.]